MAENAGSGSDDDSDQLMSIHEAARNCNVDQLARALAAMLTPKPVPADGPRRSRRRLSPLRRVPPEVLRKIAAFAFHVGYY
jgi:hypothetical protein